MGSYIEVGGTRLVINVRNVLDEVNIVSKVIRHDTAEDVLRDIVSAENDFAFSSQRSLAAHSPCMTHVGGIVYGRPAVIPLDVFSMARHKLRL
jgi:hypothetical protein